MSKFRINKEDFTERLEEFSFKCPKCHGNQTQLIIAVALYDECRGMSVHIICDNPKCGYEKEIMKQQHARLEVD